MDYSPFERPKAFGDYELLGKVGRGSAATVYKGRHKESGRIVAIKVAKRLQGIDPNELQRFEREFTVIRHLRHPNLVEALGFGERKSAPYLVLEFVDGQSLETRLNEKGPLSLHEALPILLQIGEGLAYLHQHKILHRDIKPANILVDAQGQAKLADFGLLKSLSDSVLLTRENQSMGTMDYGAPEQFQDAMNTDYRCDIYSLAATLYSTVTGQFAFGVGGNLKILQRKMLNQFLPLRQSLPMTPAVLDDLITRCLNSKIEQRPANIEEFIGGLQQASAALGPSLAGGAETANAGADAGDSNRRATDRVAVNSTAVCVPFHESRRGSWPATVLDVSPGGLRMQTSHMFPVKSILEVMLSKPPGFHIVQVRWVRASDEHTYYLGCAFVRPLPDGTFEEMCSTDATQKGPGKKEA